MGKLLKHQQSHVRTLSKEFQIQGIGEAEDADSLMQEIRNEIALDAYGHGGHDQATVSIP
ncbi:hypothetical protein PCASD_26640 [Puccinia coronata f. sp. avenae]|uniref:Uncharacterized protein n=1 Tax=Puccinia coronata f. sp. avenae TaxID=200324 RepID=A0A2N5TJA1_9BASI|nr:hypothetical protein PCASD_26640 [Puccinia coronata f. sp. avenae]